MAEINIVRLLNTNFFFFINFILKYIKRETVSIWQLRNIVLDNLNDFIIDV